MAAPENTLHSTDSPLKRQREDEVNGVSDTLSKEPQPNGLSSVIPGWFSEISPMWPGSISLITFFIFVLNFHSL